MGIFSDKYYYLCTCNYECEEMRQWILFEKTYIDKLEFAIRMVKRGFMLCL